MWQPFLKPFLNSLSEKRLYWQWVMVDKVQLEHNCCAAETVVSPREPVDIKWANP